MLKKIRCALLDKIKNVNDAYEFKPLLSEIEDSPVSPLGRFTFWTITILIIITILWLTLGRVDVVISARGIVIPDGETKTIQAYEGGVIEQILVKEGDFVTKDQLLISIDSTTTSARLSNINKNIEQSKYEAQRLKSSGTGTSFTIDNKNKELSDEVYIQQKLYQENIASLNNNIAAKQQQIAQLSNQVNSTLAQKRDYEFMLKSAEEREQRLRNVVDIIAYNELQEAQDRTNSLREAIIRSEQEVSRLKAQQAQIRNEIFQINSDFKAHNLNLLTNTQKQINELDAEKTRLEFSDKNKNIIAPCDGYIDKLLIHTIGGIVTPAQDLISLTPTEKPMIIKAQVLNKDIGFIKPNMPVSIKIDTFDFQKYGILHGTIKSISQNSIQDEKLGLIYEIFITPLEDTLIIEGHEQKIISGMTLNAEIEINQRRIIDFFIYPLIKYLDEGISVK